MGSGQCRAVHSIIIIPVNPGKVVGGLSSSPNSLSHVHRRACRVRWWNDQLDSHTGLRRHDTPSLKHDHDGTGFGDCLARNSGGGRREDRANSILARGPHIHVALTGSDRSYPDLAITWAVCRGSRHRGRDRGIGIEPIRP